MFPPRSANGPNPPLPNSDPRFKATTSSSMQSTWPWSSIQEDQLCNFNFRVPPPPPMPNGPGPAYHYNGSQAYYAIPPPQFIQPPESWKAPEAASFDIMMMTPPTSHQPVTPTSPPQMMSQPHPTCKKTGSSKKPPSLEIKMVSSKIMIGKRRGGGKTLPTGVIKRIDPERVARSSEAKSNVGEKPWTRYMAEVERYKKQTCCDDVPNRSLVK